MSPSGSVKRGASEAGVIHPFTHVGDAAPFLGGGVDGSAGGVGEMPGVDDSEGNGGAVLIWARSVLPWHAAASEVSSTISVMNLRTCSSERLKRDRKDTDRTPAW